MADTHFTFIIDEKLLKEVEKVADSNHRSISGEIRMALEEIVKRYKEEIHGNAS